MTEPGTRSELAVALAAVQSELPIIERTKTVEVVQKTGGTYSYAYAPLDKVTEAVLPLLSKHGLAFTAFPGLGSDGKMCLRYSLLHQSGESMTGEFPLSAEGGIQQLGGRITYARRYCLAAVVGLATEDDDDGQREQEGQPVRASRGTSGTKPRTRGQKVADDANPPPPVSPEADRTPPAGDEVTQPQQQKLIMQFRDLGVTDREDRLARVSTFFGWNVQSITQLTKADAHRLIEFLDAEMEARRNTDAANGDWPAAAEIPGSDS